MTMTLTKRDFPQPDADLSYSAGDETYYDRKRDRDRHWGPGGHRAPLNRDQDPRFYEPDMDA